MDFVHDILVVLYVLVKLMILLRLICVAGGSLSVISIFTYVLSIVIKLNRN